LYFSVEHSPPNKNDLRTAQSFLARLSLLLEALIQASIIESFLGLFIIALGQLHLNWQLPRL
jgi:hypothetical protein